MMVAQWLARLASKLKGGHMHRGDKPTEAPWLNGWPDIHDERVRAAFVRVPRTAFVGDDWRSTSELRGIGFGNWAIHLEFRTGYTMVLPLLSGLGGF